MLINLSQVDKMVGQGHILHTLENEGRVVLKGEICFTHRSGNRYAGQAKDRCLFCRAGGQGK